MIIYELKIYESEGKVFKQHFYGCILSVLWIKNNMILIFMSIYIFCYPDIIFHNQYQYRVKNLLKVCYSIKCYWIPSLQNFIVKTKVRFFILFHKKPQNFNFNKILKSVPTWKNKNHWTANIEISILFFLRKNIVNNSIKGESRNCWKSKINKCR